MKNLAIFLLMCVVVFSAYEINKFVIQYENQMKSVYTLLDDMACQDRETLEVIGDATEELEKTFTTKLNIDLPNSEDMLKSNLLLMNRKIQGLGSGTYITYKGKKYVLTCSHLTSKDNQILSVVTKSPLWRRMVLVKIDRTNDLALYRVSELNVPTIELSDRVPVVGSTVYLVGNPGGIEDVISNGIVAKIDEKGYFITNKMFFGNSGGGLMYEGKLIGVTNSVAILNTNGVTETYGYCIRLSKILKFLEGV